MKLGHDGRRLGHGGNRLVREVLGVGAREADAFDARLTHGTQQLGKAGRAIALAAEGVDVLPQKADLADTVLMERTHLVDDALERSVALAATHVGNDAIAAEVVAARHDGHPRMPDVLAPARQVGGEARVILARVRKDILLGAVEGVHDEVGKARDRTGAKDDIDVAHVLANAGAVTLGDAATDAHDPAAVRGLGGAHHCGNLTVEVRVGLLADAARHEDDDIGLIGSGDLKAAARPKKTRHALRVMKVHLTAKRLHVIRETSKRRDVAHLNCHLSGTLLDGRSVRRRKPVDIHRNANGRAALAVDIDVRERGGARDVDSRGNEEATSDGHGLDRLVHSPSPHRLDVDGNPVLHHAGNRTGDRSRRGLARDLQVVHVCCS